MGLRHLHFSLSKPQAMKPLFPRPIPAIFQIANFSNAPFHPSHATSSSSRRHEAESRRVKVSVWWDFENCNLPTGSNVFRVTQGITAAIRANGIKGPIQITAFGDVMQMSRVNQEVLSSTGISFTHVPNGGKNSADRSLLVALMYWVSQNPPPAHLFLISGDRDFASILHRLRMNNYNILLATLESVPSVLSSAASIMWQWNALIRGENLTGRHFNQPPDGPYGSWYGHFKSPLEDPFVAMEQPTLSCTQEPSNSNSELKIRPIPKAVQKLILHILCSKPAGISSKELRSELDKSNLSIDKDLYGYKKFSCFLLAMPHILKLQSGNDGQFLVRGVCSKASEQNGGISRITAAGVSNAGVQADSKPQSAPSPYCVPKMKTSKNLQKREKVK
nr:meiosis arrest female protein 1-like [Ipomoea batatas]